MKGTALYMKPMVDKVTDSVGRGYGGREAAFLSAGEGLQQVPGRAVAAGRRRALALAAAGECALAAPGRDAGARAGALPQQWPLMSAPFLGVRLTACSSSAAGTAWTYRGNVWLVATLSRLPFPRMQGRGGKAAEQRQGCGNKTLFIMPRFFRIVQHSLSLWMFFSVLTSPATVQPVISSRQLAVICCS